MKTYLISGSSSGIGRAIATTLLAQGHRVIGLARDHSQFSPETQHYHTVTVDFADIDTLEACFKDIKQNEPSLHGLICCAGFGRFATLEQFSQQQIQDMMNVNFISQVLFIKAFLPQLKKQQQGDIIVLGSEAALQGSAKGSLYCASKFALRGFCQSLRAECRTAHVGVSLINPGFVDTPFFDDLDFEPKDRQIHAIAPERIAALVSLILAEDDVTVFEEINLQPMTKVMAWN